MERGRVWCVNVRIVSVTAVASSPLKNDEMRATSEVFFCVEDRVRAAMWFVPTSRKQDHIRAVVKILLKNRYRVAPLDPLCRKVTVLRRRRAYSFENGKSVAASLESIVI